VRQYWVYIATNMSGTLYTGVTNNLRRRMHEHRDRKVPGFTSRYRINRLVFFEATPDIKVAINRERQIKGWTRRRKIQLIETANPEWEDLGHLLAGQL
jgi:putative endonuclease